VAAWWVKIDLLQNYFSIRNDLFAAVANYIDEFFSRINYHV
jgi:hypothetical protein